MEQVHNNVLIVGDFNFPDIDWNSCHSRGNDLCSIMFLDTIQNNFLNQYVDFPTRIRGSDTPHIFDLVLTDVLLIEKIDYLAPLGKSDHSVLLIETTVLGSREQNSPKYNLAKGDYISFGEHMSMDWVNFVQDCNNNVEKM